MTPEQTRSPPLLDTMGRGQYSSLKEMPQGHENLQFPGPWSCWRDLGRAPPGSPRPSGVWDGEGLVEGVSAELGGGGRAGQACCEGAAVHCMEGALLEPVGWSGGCVILSGRENLAGKSVYLDISVCGVSWGGAGPWPEERVSTGISSAVQSMCSSLVERGPHVTGGRSTAL